MWNDVILAAARATTIFVSSCLNKFEVLKKVPPPPETHIKCFTLLG